MVKPVVQTLHSFKHIEFIIRVAQQVNRLIKHCCKTVYHYWLLFNGIHPIWETQKGVVIGVRRGTKPQSDLDFVVRFREPKKRWRTPRHIHLVVELYVKEAHNPQLTYALRDHLIFVFNQIQPITSFPPKLQVYQPGDEQKFASLDAVGEFSVEFIMVVSELIFIQEKTNYPSGSLTKELYEDFGRKDRFSVIHKAVFRGQGA
jgi:hypothetical protein